MDDIPHAWHGMQDGGCGDADKIILEDILPDSTNLGYVTTTWQFRRVTGQLDLISVEWISWEAKLVDDVWGSQKSVRICEARTNVCTCAEWSVYLQWLAIL